MQLPVAFTEQMRTLLGNAEWEAFCTALDMPPQVSLRPNIKSKFSPLEWRRHSEDFVNGQRSQTDAKKSKSDAAMLKASRTAHRLSAKPVPISKSSESDAANLKFECRRHREKALSQSAKPERNLQEPLRAKRQIYRSPGWGLISHRFHRSHRFFFVFVFVNLSVQSE